MLDSIRSGAQSFGVKVAFGIIILVFVFWGIGNFNDRDYSNVVAVVNGNPILALEFEKAYHNAEENILRSNPNITRQQLAADHLGRQVLQDLIQMSLLEQEANRTGIKISPLEMRLYVDQIKAFQDDNGKFDPDVYKRVLAAQRISPAQFESDLYNQLLRDKVYSFIASAAWIDPEEPLNRYNYLMERREIDYLFIPAAKFQDNVKISEDAAKAWYESHLQNFAIPPKIDVSYIAVTPESLIDINSIDEGAAKKWYEANLSRFETKEQVKASHILAPLEADADEAARQAATKIIEEAKAELASGKSFAEVADKYNPQGAADKGGALGWISRGETVPEFEEAVFAATPGKVTEVVNTPFGMHLIIVEEKKEAGHKSFEEVKDEVYKAIASEEGADKIHDALDNLIEDNILQKPMETSAARYGLQVQKSGLVDKPELMQKLGIKAADADALFAASSGSPLDTALEAGDKYIVARVVESTPAGTKPFNDVKNEIIDILQKEGAQKEALAEADNLLQKIKNQTPEQIKDEKLDLKTGVIVDRAVKIADFEITPALTEMIFTTKPENWLDKAYPVIVPDGAMLVRVDKILTPQEGEFEGLKNMLANSLKQERQDAIYALFLQSLLNKAEVKILNQDFIDRVNM